MNRIALFLAGLFLLAASADASEPWSDSDLKVKDGLQVWLDAARQNEARRALKQPELAGEGRVGTWYDASGNGRHLIQNDAQLQPIFALVDGHPALRFDGRQQYCARLGLGMSLKEATIFIVTVPFSNRGDFRGFLALNETDKNDYVTGLTIDQGSGPTPRFESVNVEGAGFGGAFNLQKEAFEFGLVQRICATTAAGKGGTKLYSNGTLHGQRDRADTQLRMDQLTVGARFYTNGGPPQVRGFLDGDILEVLIFDRVLSDDERSAIDRYLAAKHGDLRKVPMPVRAAGGKPLVSVADPPPVQMFVPGFTVRELPVNLTNINNVLYRPDGKLVALAYDGNIYVLSDSDGDGLEDKVELFWDNKGRLRAPIGMCLTPPNYKHGNGVFVASKGKCSLIVDSSGTGKADKEIIVADGWKEISHGVDALGVAIDPKDGSICFGLGTQDYTNAYLIDKEGKAGYSLRSERGTILRVAPDFESREILCTGIRFPVGIRFNKDGDLFCTDQEGATWLPNGNPLDELLHIRKGRHYGFPPRHPKHLPGVVDEPSTFDYGPQHQCTCGLNFNEPVNGGPVFGPEWWRSSAIVAGYSRGKLFRTTLVKSDAGYVAQNQLLACLNMLAVDACVSPTGDLVVAVHSGGPDWGSGPSGKGKLYKISYTGKDLPQPIVAWPQGPREVRIAFDRPVDPALLQSAIGAARIEYGKYVAAGDRFEKLRPGYQAVADQLASPRFDLPVLGLQVTKDRRTVIVATAEHPGSASYALTLPGLGRPPKTDQPKGALPQFPETDLRYDLCGVEASWQGADGSAWSGWLPHLDLAVARKLTVGSAEHERLWANCHKPGKLTLRTRMLLHDMLRPAVQPGSKIDYELPAEQVMLAIQSPGEIVAKGPDGPVALNDKGRRLVGTLTVIPRADVPVPLELVMTTGKDLELQVSWSTREDDRPRPVQLHRLLLPWAALKKDERPIARDIPELKGGNWARGRKVFFGEQAACFKCHSVHGEGERIGPDLSNLSQRDYPSVLRDIVDPNFAINPDYITHQLTLKDGRTLTGTVRTEGGKLLIADTTGKVTTLRPDLVESMTPQAVSIMPEGLPKLIGPDKMKDLLTFLMEDPPRMTDYGKDTPPPPRTMKEVAAVLAGAPKPPEKVRPIHVVLVAGRKDHGPGEHDYPAWQKVWRKLLALTEDTRVTVADDWPTSDNLKSADVLVFYQQGKWTAERARDIDAFLERGGGLVYIHYAVDGGADAPGFAQRIGLAWRGGQSKFRHGPLDLGFETGASHPIGRNFDRLHFHDESYWNLVGDPKKITLLASGPEEGQPQPLFWALEPGKGRVFVSIPGHFAWTFDDPLFRVLLLRGIAWAAREPIDRFNDIVKAGARIER
jgi:putative heme-binding domain-containing protein